MLSTGLLVIVIELTMIMGQSWQSPYETYDRDFYSAQPYQGSYGYGGGCANIIVTGMPCPQPVRQWQMYPEYSSQYYNMRPRMPEMLPQMFVPYGGDMMMQNSGNFMDLLNRGTFSSSAGLPSALGTGTLSTRLLGANILNDKDKFETRGCSYDANRGRCSDNLNICKGKCKDFGSGAMHDCRCIPEDLLNILGLTVLRK